MAFEDIVQWISNAAVPGIILFIVGYGFARKVKVYEACIEGAKGGFEVALKIIPYLMAILVAIGMFRASGAMELLVTLIRPLTNLIGMPPEALPVALMRPLSGSGSLGLVSEIMTTHGPDSFLGRLVSTMYGSTETTFYVLAVYFGSVGIRRTRHAVAVGLLADAAGLLAALFFCRWLFAGS